LEAEVNKGYRRENARSTLLYMFSLITFVAAIGAVDVLALRYGADSRRDERQL